MLIPKAKSLLLAVFLSGLLIVAFQGAARATPATVSCYGPEAGPSTATGEPFDPWGMTAAHPDLPFGTDLLITYKDKSAVVRVNDRGNYDGRWDLSFGGCSAVGLLDVGVDTVDVKVVEPEEDVGEKKGEGSEASAAPSAPSPASERSSYVAPCAEGGLPYRAPQESYWEHPRRKITEALEHRATKEKAAEASIIANCSSS